MCKLSLTEASNLFMNDLRASKKYQDSMAQAIAEADARYESDMAELEALFPEEPEELTVEAVEIELASIDDYRGQALDSNINEYQWINDNIKVFGDNIIDTLSKLLNKSPSSTASYILKSLGIKHGTEYQNKQREYMDSLSRGFEYDMYNELTAYLKKARLYDFYTALLDYVKHRISAQPLSYNDDELTFYVLYDDLRKTCKKFNINRGITNDQLWGKLNSLCGLGLIDNLSSEYIEESQLNKAEEIAEYVRNTISEDDVVFNRRNFYILNDLSPTVQEEAIKRIQLETECHLRKHDKNATTLAMVYGEDTQKRIISQKDPNINPVKLKNFIDAANILLKKQRYYTEEQLRIQYMKKDRNIKKKDAIVLTAMYLSKTVLETNCITTRVNKQARKNYELPDKIKSNSFIYVSKEDK